MPIQTPIRGLRSFCIAAKCLSFKHAAEQLYLTPSAVSHQIRQLEEQLGVTLFHRHTRAIQLTAAGHQFYRSIEPLIDKLEQTIRDFSTNKHKRTISLTCPEFFGSELLIPRLSQWADLYPDIDLKLELLKYQQDGNKATDLSVVLSGSRPSEGLVHELFPIRYVPACNLALYTKWQASDNLFVNEATLVLHKARPWAWHQWAEVNGVRDFQPKQIIQFDSMYAVARAAQKGVGIALVPLPMSNAWFKEQLLFKLSCKEVKSKDKYYLIQHELHDSRDELSVFMQWLTQTLRHSE